MTGVRAPRVLVIRSRLMAHGALGDVFRTRNCSIFRTASNTRVRRVLSRCSVGLIVVSVGLPNGGNLLLTHRLHRRTGITLVFLANHSGRISGVLNLRVNTSSCVAGPFGPHRLAVHTHGLLSHAVGLNAIDRRHHDIRDCGFGN